MKQNSSGMRDSMFGTTTSTTSTIQEGLTYESLTRVLLEMKSRLTVVFYMASDYVPVVEDGEVTCIDNLGATEAGFDIICHPSQISLMKCSLFDQYNLQAMSEAERFRRLDIANGKRMGRV